jgi:16S rRNA (cytosine967-C5)-methyltransferase
MTPAARIDAAITILDDILTGRTAEKALSDWGRNSRFAGSKDRAALRDLVFDALRMRGSCAAFGGGLTGRGLMIGLAVISGADVTAMFTGIGHAPDTLSEAETDHVAQTPDLAEHDANDMPAWLWPVWQADLGAAAEDAAQILRSRAPLYLRVNQRRGTVENAINALAAEQIAVSGHDTQPGCLRVESNPRRVKLSRAFEDGLVEVQDAASQIAVAQLAVPNGARVLDYCAGGGGKSLAIADQFECTVTAHDIAEQRTKDIGPRADRAGVNIDVRSPDTLPKDDLFDIVVVDAPCSGSGTWRRNPESKWSLTSEKLANFSVLQGEVILTAAMHVRAGGALYYMTCSVFDAENRSVVDHFVRGQSDWTAEEILRLKPSDQSDGFYLCKLTKTG